MTRADIIREFFAEDESRKDWPSRTVARYLHQSDPQVWTSVNSARRVVNYARGLCGKRDRKKLDSNPENKRHTKKPGWMTEAVPKPLSERREPFKLSGPMTIGVLSDIHVPYHDKRAVEAAVAELKRRKPDVVYLNGDTADFYGISRHQKDPRKVNVAHELESVRQLLFWIRSQFKRARIVYKIGNHDDRMERYLASNAPVLLGVSEFELDHLLKFKDMGIERVDSLQFAYAGKLPILHGHELPKGGGVNPARWAFLKAAQTIMIGHFHRTSEHTDATGLSRKVTVCHSTGCLCDLNPDYASVNQWNHGFAVVELDAKNNHRTSNLKIIDGEVF